MENQAVNRKIPFWQIMRGICILAVIMIHCPSPDISTDGNLMYGLWVFIRQITLFPVPVFFFMAGYFVNQDKVKSSPKSYICSRGGVLLVPYILWTTFYSLISISGVVRDGTSIDWSAYALNFITGGASAPLYYIICLLQFTLLTPLLLKAMEKRGAADKILWLISFAYLVFIYVCFAIIPDSYFMSGTIRGLFFPAWMLFYYLGLNTKANNLAVNGLVDRFGKFRFVFIAFVLECIESVIVLKCDGNSGLATGLFKISSFLYAFSICLLCMNLAHRNQEGENNLQRVLHHIGDRSYGVFYIHCFIIMVLMKVYNYVGISDIWILKFTICFILTSVISVLTVDMVNAAARTLKIDRSLKLIGF